MNNFNLEYQYQMFLQRVGLSESQMPADQRREIKIAFMAAMGQMLMICVNDLNSFKNPLVTEAVPYMSDQIKEFFANQIDHAEKEKHRGSTNKMN